MSGLAPSPVRPHIEYMETGRAVLQRILRDAPGSIRELAREAGVSHRLLRAARDGDRNLTPATRDAVLRALRTWAGTCSELADALEAAELDRPGGDNG